MKKRKKICILTATRSEYGLLKPVIQKLKQVPGFDVLLAVTGMHLSPEFGLTYQEIENDGISIDEKIEIQMSSDTPAGISKTMALALMGFADYFAKSKPDLLLVLGDRYETLAVCCAAMNQQIPIAHMHGGETTEGAIDEAIRHSITKMSYLHFTSTEEYRKRVIQLGEAPDRVFNVGAVGVENVKTQKLLSKAELEKSINVSLEKPYTVITFHPVTLEDDTSEKQFREMLDAFLSYPDLLYLFTKANADKHGRIINQMIDNFVQENHNANVWPSLGTTRYLSALKHSTFVIGNSSSGIIEAPSLGVPTINIGDRQKGRVQASSVINCKPIKKEIEKAIALALSDEFKKESKNTYNPYGDGKTSGKVVEILIALMAKDHINLKKQFNDIY